MCFLYWNHVDNKTLYLFTLFWSNKLHFWKAQSILFVDPAWCFGSGSRVEVPLGARKYCGEWNDSNDSEIPYSFSVKSILKHGLITTHCWPNSSNPKISQKDLRLILINQFTPFSSGFKVSMMIYLQNNICYQKTWENISLRNTLWVASGETVHRKKQLNAFTSQSTSCCFLWVLVTGDTVDGRNLHHLISCLSHYLQGFIHPRWCRISSINSRNHLM